VPTLAPTPHHGHTLAAAGALDLLAGEVRRIAHLAAEADPHSPVPGCPEWTLADVVKHAGEVHARTAATVERLAQQRLDSRAIQLDVPTDAAALPTWFNRTGEKLVETLRRADPDAPVYSWGADHHVRFWIRRMLHETTVHRLDVEAAAGVTGAVDPGVAVDGIDELLDLLPYAAWFRPQVRDLHGDGETIHLHATDLEGSGLTGEWLITLEPDGFRWSHAHVKGAAALRGPVRDLLLYAYGRRGRYTLESFGDEGLLTHWSAKSAL
jgi:uncharacterized protein (TIGR03083 family)